MPRISQLVSLTAVDNADELAIVDVSASVTKKITRAALLSSAPLPNNTVTTTSVSDGAITYAKTDGKIWWEELGRTTLASAADLLSSTFTTKKYLRVIVSVLPTGGTIEPSVRFNSDSSANYAVAVNTNGTVSAAANQAQLAVSTGASANQKSITLEITNLSGAEKTIFSTSVEQTGTGAGSAPGFRHGYMKYASNTQVSSVQVLNTGTGDFAIGSELVVLGHN